MFNIDYKDLEVLVLASEAVHNVKDLHAERAAQHFGISVSDVTKEQRRVGKSLNFLTIYNLPTK